MVEEAALHTKPLRQSQCPTRTPFVNITYQSWVNEISSCASSDLLTEADIKEVIPWASYDHPLEMAIAEKWYMKPSISKL